MDRWKRILVKEWEEEAEGSESIGREAWSEVEEEGSSCKERSL